MLSIDARRFIEWVLFKTQIFIGILIVAFGAALKADAAATPSLSGLLHWMQSCAWIVVLFGPIAVGTVQFCRRYFGAPWAWEAIQKVLDELRAEVFAKVDREPEDYHRVTLFARRIFNIGGWWTWRSSSSVNPLGWLVAVARSGHLTKWKIRRFRAPDDGEKCEGVVGCAWRKKDWVIVPSTGKMLPDLNLSSLDAEIAEYSSQTWTTDKWVRQQLKYGRPLAGCYAALRVLLKGRPWGVLVIDSRTTGAIDGELLQVRFRAYASLLTPLLEKV